MFMCVIVCHWMYMYIYKFECVCVCVFVTVIGRPLASHHENYTS